MMIGRRALFALLSLASIGVAAACCYGYFALALKVGNTTQDPKIQRIAIAWPLGAAAGVCAAIAFAVATVVSWIRIRN